MKEHATGRFCEDTSCGGKLYDSIINFGENLPEKDLDNGFTQSQIADLHICLGSSLRVTPAADMPVSTVENGGKLVVINLQDTPLNSYAALVIHAKCDDVMRRLSEYMDFKINKWVMEKYGEVALENNKLVVTGRDTNNNTYSIFKQVDFKYKDSKGKTVLKKVTKEPFNVKLSEKE